MLKKIALRATNYLHCKLILANSYKKIWFLVFSRLYAKIVPSIIWHLKTSRKSLQFRRTTADLLETYSIITSQHLIDTNCYFIQCPMKNMLTLNTTTRGHIKKLQTQQSTGHRQNFLDVWVTSLWNQLSNGAVNSKNIEIFKNYPNKEIGHMKLEYKFSY